MDKFEKYRQFAESLAKEAGNRILATTSSFHEIRQKACCDFVTEVDRNSEFFIKHEIQRHYPTHMFWGEEEASEENKDAFSILATSSNNTLWIVDPLDGTTNFIRGIPQYSVSIAVAENNTIVAGVIYVPLSDELFSASLGQGATLNGKSIHVSEIDKLEKSILSSAFPAVDFDYRDRAVRCISSLSRKCLSLRIFNSAALCLAYVSCGRTEAHWEQGIHIWDIAAGALIVIEAGGSISDIQGNPVTLCSTDIIASNGKMTEQFRPHVQISNT
jgi:myo-inositol-1(or 4)-monophosphatase